MDILALLASAYEWADKAAAILGYVIAGLLALQVFLAAVAAMLRGVGSQVPPAAGVYLVQAAASLDAAAHWCGDASPHLLKLVGWLRGILPKAPPPAALLLLLAIPLCLASTACAGSFEIAKVAGATDRGVTRAQVSYGAGATAAPADPKRCQALDETHMVWSSFAKAGAALTGGAGLATIPADDQGARIGLAVGAVIVGAFTAAAITVADSSAESWSRECSAP